MSLAALFTIWWFFCSFKVLVVKLAKSIGDGTGGGL
jgi:hypothetical protein